MVLLEELECACCYELMVNPTTLNCGHSFCKYCLAKWFNASNKTECPECRQTWIGYPQVNVHLRTIVEKSFPEEAKDRKEAQLSLPGYSEVVEQFEKLRSSTGQAAVNVDDRVIHGIIGLIFLAACILVASLVIGFLYYVFVSTSKPREAIYSKTVDQWTPLDVATWAHGFTKQFGHDYSMSFAHAGVDGQLLVELTDDDLESLPLNISTPLHRKIFIGEITRLNTTRVKHPTNLWEYKDAHRGNILFLLFMLQDSPRLTFVYLHYMEYDTIFLPFLRTVMDTNSCPSDGIICPTIEDIGVSEKLRFYMKVVAFPYYLILKYAWPFTDIHFLTTWIIISHCVMLTFGELSRLYTLPAMAREFPSQITEFIVTFIITCIWYWSLLSIVPGFVLDIVFYGKLYYGPIETANRMRNGEFRANILAKLLNGVSVIGQAIWRMFLFFLNRRIP